MNTVMTLIHLKHMAKQDGEMAIVVVIMVNKVTLVVKIGISILKIIFSKKKKKLNNINIFISRSHKNKNTEIVLIAATLNNFFIYDMIAILFFFLIKWSN